MQKFVAIPVYNEQDYVDHVLDKVRGYIDDVLVIDDGSTDDTPLHLARQPVEVIRHARNRGYGIAIRDAFRWARCYGYDWVITMDCDEQHEPEALPTFFEAIERDDADIISGSRYLDDSLAADRPPSDRRAINEQITDLINRCLKLTITDAFCGYKAYRVSALDKVRIDEPGYAMPLQFWVQAAARGLRVTEVPVRLIYNDPNRSFGGPLNDADQRLKYYLEVFRRELAAFPEKFASPDAVGSPCTCSAK